MKPIILRARKGIDFLSEEKCQQTHIQSPELVFRIAKIIHVHVTCLVVFRKIALKINTPIESKFGVNILTSDFISTHFRAEYVKRNNAMW